MERVPNTPVAIQAWTNQSSVRNSVNVTYTAVGTASVGKASVYLVSDGFPRTARNIRLLGVDYGSRDELRLIFDDLEAKVARAPPGTATNNSQLLGITPMYLLRAPFNTYGFVMVSTVMTNDPTALLLAVVMPVSQFVNDVLNKSNDVVVRVYDNPLVPFESGGCAFSDAEHSISGTVRVADEVQWHLHVGACPKYAKAYHTEYRTVAVVVTVVVGVVLQCIAVCGVWSHNRHVEQRVAIVKHEESTRAHRWIIGYICHELRNPLHVLKTSVEYLSTLAPSGGAVSGVAESASASASATNGVGVDGVVPAGSSSPKGAGGAAAGDVGFGTPRSAGTFRAFGRSVGGGFGFSGSSPSHRSRGYSSEHAFDVKEAEPLARRQPGDGAGGTVSDAERRVVFSDAVDAIDRMEVRGRAAVGGRSVCSPCACVLA